MEYRLLLAGKVKGAKVDAFTERRQRKGQRGYEEKCTKCSQKEQFKVGGTSQAEKAFKVKPVDSVWVVPADHGVAH